MPSIPFIDGKLPKPDSLPFIKRRNPKGSGYRYWAVNPSGDYGRDCETGAVYAKMLLPFLKYNAGISMLGSIVLDMIEAGNDKVGKGLIVGFMSELSIELSQTRAELSFFAASAWKGRVPAKYKTGRALIKVAAAKAAVPTLKRLGDVV